MFFVSDFHIHTGYMSERSVKWLSVKIRDSNKNSWEMISVENQWLLVSPHLNQHCQHPYLNEWLMMNWINTSCKSLEMTSRTFWLCRALEIAPGHTVVPRRLPGIEIGNWWLARNSEGKWRENVCRRLSEFGKLSIIALFLKTSDGTQVELSLGRRTQSHPRSFRSSRLSQCCSPETPQAVKFRNIGKA